MSNKTKLLIGALIAGLFMVASSGCVVRTKTAKPKPKPIKVIVKPPAPAAPGVLFHPNGCKTKLNNPKKRAACISCTARNHPHKYLPGAPQGTRCRVR